jgi:hypothetical protein
MSAPLRRSFSSLRRGFGAALIAALAGGFIHGAVAGGAGIVFLPPAGGYDTQLGGDYPPPAGVTTVSRDRQSPPAPGLYSICYFNGFQTQADETEWWQQNHPDLLLRGKDGKPVEDKKWPGEFLLDTSTDAKRRAIFGVIGAWVRKCAEDGFNAIEPDNLDSWSRSSGLLTINDNLALVRLMSDLAHDLGLAVAQKNNSEIGATGKVLAGFDFAIAEECEVYDECDAYTSNYIQVLEIEYTDNDPDAFKRACSKRGGKIPIVLRDRNLTMPENKAYRFEMC